MIGAYRPDMREADDEALQKSRLFVDSFDTTLGHIGELKIPLETGAIVREHVLADYYDLAAFQAGPEDITVFKNGGGAHLDLDDRAVCFGSVAGLSRALKQSGNPSAG